MTTLDLPATESVPVKKKAQGLPLDVLLLVVVGALVAFGLLMVYSTTFDWSYRQYGDPSAIFLRQVRSLGVGLLAMVVAAWMPYGWWRKLVVPLMGATVLALIGVLVIGSETFNAQRSFFNGSVQPSEPAKLVTILYLGVWLDSKRDRIHEWSYGLVPFGVIVGIVAGLVYMQPDLSAVVTVVIVAALMFFMGGADILQMALAGALGVAVGSVLIRVSATAQQRVADYLAGMQSLTEASWHVQQAAIAFVSGGVFGRGLGHSYQKFGFLPTPHTDSVFAIVGEELGLVGCVAVVALFVALAWRGFRIAANARDGLGSILAAGIVSWISVEALINIAVMVNAVPFAGNALPFISYGGSSLVVTLAAVGVLLSISRRDSNESIPRKTMVNPFARGQRAGRHAASNLGRRNGRRRVPRTVGGEHDLD